MVLRTLTPRHFFVERQHQARVLLFAFWRRWWCGSRNMADSIASKGWWQRTGHLAEVQLAAVHTRLQVQGYKGCVYVCV